MLDSETPWFVYFIRTKTQTLYCGITTDLARRLAQHQAGKGAKYLRGKGPLDLVWHSEPMTHLMAAKQEYAMKQWSKAKKEAFLMSAKNPA